jgi:peptide/nickel transport system substrate-binding protein
MRTRTRAYLASAAAALLLLTTACGSDDDAGGSSGSSDSSDASSDDGGAAGGELTIAYSFPPASLDPIAPGQFETYLYPLYDTLTSITDDQEVQPRLATSWSFPDASSMVIELRDDVVFHDGTPFDAAAVKANLDRARTAEQSSLQVTLSGIESVEVVDDHTVQLGLTRGGSELPALFARLPGMMVSPQVIADAPDSIATGAGGSGPYLLEEFRANEAVSFVNNPDRWNQDVGLLDRMTITGITVGQQRLNALQAGDVDLAQMTSTDVAGAASDIESGTLDGTVVDLTASQNYLVLRSTLPPFDDPAVREAVARAIDKEALSEGLYQGTCTPADQFFPEGHFAHDESLEGRFAYDADAAQDLLADAGVDSPTITLDHFETFTEPAVALQQLLTDVGFDVELNQLNANENNFADGTRQAYVGSMFGVIDPSQVVGDFLLGGAIQALDDPDGELAGLLDTAADPTVDDEDRAAAYRDIWEAAYGEAIVIPLCNAQQAWVHTGNVANVEDIGYTFAGTVDLTALTRAGG